MDRSIVEPGVHPASRCRETLIDLFDRELVETQEAAGMRVLGQFRDLDDPDAFVWLRGFRDMPARGRALTAFYDGPVWERHGGAAGATMIDSDDVLLLRPVDTRLASPSLPTVVPPPAPARFPPGWSPSRPARSAVTGPARFLRSSKASSRPRFAPPARICSRASRPSTLVTTSRACRSAKASRSSSGSRASPTRPPTAGIGARFDLEQAVADWTDAAPETCRLTPTSRSLLRG